MGKEKVLGFCDFTSVLHRDNGGKIKIAAYTSVNKPVMVESHDETTKIASRRYKIVEEEKPELDGSKFYEKNVWNEQEGGSNESPKRGTEKESENEYAEPKNGTANDLPAWGKVLKNFADELSAGQRAMWVVIVVVAILAAIALTKAFFG